MLGKLRINCNRFRHTTSTLVAKAAQARKIVKLYMAQSYSYNVHHLQY